MKILFLDIETAPNIAYVWGKYQQDVIDYLDEWSMLTFAAKWKDKKTEVFGLPDFKNWSEKELIKTLHKYMDEADVIVGHNLDFFDVRKVNARFVFYGLNPPSPYKTVDTYKIARKQFYLNSNKLGDLAKYLGIGDKIKTGGFDLWLGCIWGNKSSWKKMKQYNKNDVDITAKIYERLLPWITNHPNHNLFEGKGCPNCGSSELQRRGFSVTRVNKYQRVHCQNCGAWSRERMPEKVDKPEVV